MGTKHHYVPRFYLKQFASDSKKRRVNVFNISRRALFSNVGLKDQCYRDHFYGNDGAENALELLEGRWALLLARIVETRRLPAPKSLDHGGLCLFVAAQVLRTEQSSEQHEEMIGQASEIVARGNKRVQELIKRDHSAPGLAGLRHFVLSGIMLDDLAARLIHLPTPLLVTSDHPVVRYNLYMERTVGVGTNGFACRGLLVFVPLSQHTLLMLFDSAVYNVSRNRDRLIQTASASDIHQLNLLQALNARTNLFVPNNATSEHCNSLIQQVESQRRKLGPRVREYGHVNDPAKSLLVTYFEMPSISLQLSFLRIGREADRIPEADRVNLRHRSNPVADMVANRRNASVPIRFPPLEAQE